MPVEQSLRTANTQPFSMRKSSPVIVIKKDLTAAKSAIFASTAMPVGCKFLIESIHFTSVSGDTVVVTFTDEYTLHVGGAVSDVIHITNALNFTTYPDREWETPKALLVAVALSGQVTTGVSCTVTICGRMIKGRIDVQD